MSAPFSPDETFARRRDERDPLRACRDLFEFPAALRRPNGAEAVYMCGNSLGLMPKTARTYVEQELDDWARFAVEGHFEGRRPWFSYHELFRDIGARLVGAVPGEVVMMNSLTVNLHLMMVSFYRPTKQRFKIVIEDGAFPSDWHAVASQLRFHGVDPAKGLIALKPRGGEATLRTEDIEATIEKEGDSIALVMLGGVNYFTGQLFDMARIAAAGHRVGAVVGFDLAHAAGNAPLALHDWGVDFAVWCSYKYLNSGPGAVAGCFVHEKHWSGAKELPRFEGWWGHDPATRFKMAPGFAPARGADVWQLSNPPIMAMAPLLASLEIFDRVGMNALREKSLALTGYLEFLLGERMGASARVITPRDPAQRGAQLSVVLEGAGRDLLRTLRASGLVCDFREPNVVRLAPAPLYNSFHDAWLAAGALATCCADAGGGAARRP